MSRPQPTVASSSDFGVVFQTRFALAGGPLDFEALDRVGHYPVGIRAFALVLIPLVCLYFMVRTAYSQGVLVLSDWPAPGLA